MTLGVAYPYGLRDLELWPITAVATETLGTLLDIPASRVFSFTESEEYTTLRGDDKNITTRGKGAEGQWELEAGGVSFDVLKAIVGGTLTDSGTTPSQKRVLRKKATDQRPWFKIEGQVIGDTGDVHGICYRCRCTSDVKYEFKDGEWFLTNCSGVILPSLAVATADALYDLVFNETATVIA